MVYIQRLLPTIFFAAIFGLVIWQVKPPQTVFDASLTQLVLFYLPLYLLLTSLTNLYFQFLPKSLIASLGLILLPVLKSLDSLNLVTFTLTIVSSILITKSFKKTQKTTFGREIPKLSRLKKQ